MQERASTKREPAYKSRTRAAGETRCLISDHMDADAFRSFVDDMLANTWRDPERVVYFIASENGPIKIGYTKGLRNRLSMLRAEFGPDLRVFATAPGGAAIETAYHIKFERHRLHGEWFERCPEIEAEIARLNEVAA